MDFLRAHRRPLAGTLGATFALLIAGPRTAAAEVVSVSNLDVTLATSGCSKTIANKSAAGGQLSVGGQSFASGYGTCANSSLAIALGGRGEQFFTQVGVDDVAGTGGSVVFRVADEHGTAYWESPRMTGGMAPVSLTLDITGITTLYLIADSDGDGTAGDYADWLNTTIAYSVVPPAAADAGAAPLIRSQYVDHLWIKVPDTSSSVAYTGSWAPLTGIASDFSTAHTTHTRGDTANFTFVGTYVRFYGTQHSGNGQARVWLDGVVQTIVDESGSSIKSDAGPVNNVDAVLFESSHIPYGTHSLTVENLSSSTSTPCVVNAFAYRTPATPWDTVPSDAGAGGSGGGGGGAGGSGAGGASSHTHGGTHSGTTGSSTATPSKGGCAIQSGAGEAAWSELSLGLLMLLFGARRASQRRNPV